MHCCNRGMGLDDTMTLPLEQAAVPNGSGIILGEPMVVPPVEAQGNLLQFVDELNSENGPFIFLTEGDPRAEQFIAWLMIYDQDAYQFLAKAMMLKAVPEMADTPLWLKSGQLRFKKALYDEFHQSMMRVDYILRTYGNKAVETADVQPFGQWWMQYDPSGFAAFAVLSHPQVGVSAGQPDMPVALFDYWKRTQGKFPPTDSLIGRGWWVGVKRNWLWIVGGVFAGGMIAKKVMPKKETLGMTSNPDARYIEGWGEDVFIGSGNYHLHPMLSYGSYKKSRARNMRNSRKFRVSSEGQSLGELHKSTGRYRWKAISYSGPVKYGNSRADLLGWLKAGAALEEAQYVASLAENNRPQCNCCG